MKLAWNETLSVLETELPTLLAVLEEYDDLMEETAEELARRVATASAGRFTPETIEGDNPGQWGITWRPAGDLSTAGLEVNTWPSASYGGPPGWMRIGVFLRKELPAGFPGLADAAAAAREALDGWGQHELGSPPPDACDDDELLCVGLVSLEITSDKLVDELLSATLGGCSGAESAAEAVLALHEETPYLWLLRGLDDLSAALKEEGADFTRGTWQGGRYVQLREERGAKAWVSALPDGTLRLHWPAKGAEHVTAERLAETVAGTPADLRKNRGVTLLSEAQVEALRSEDRVVEVVRTARKALFEWSRLLTGPEPI